MLLVGDRISRSLTADIGEACGGGFIGLYLAAASFAAMLEGDGVRSTSGTPKVLELFDLLSSCIGDRVGRAALLELPPVASCLTGEAGLVLFLGVPASALVAASNAPLPPPVYVLLVGFGFTGGFEKAEDAPRRAASLTLNWVSPAVFGALG